MSELLDLAALIRAETPLLVIETPDEARVMELFRQSLMHVWRALYRWSVTEGLRRVDMDSEDESGLAPDLSATLNAMREASQRGVYLLLDATPYLGYASYQRALRDLIQRRGSQPHVIVLVGTKIELPEALAPFAARFSLRLPDANALLKLVKDEARDYAAQNGGRRVEADADAVRQIVRNLHGLTLTDARRVQPMPESRTQHQYAAHVSDAFDDLAAIVDAQAILRDHMSQFERVGRRPGFRAPLKHREVVLCHRDGLGLVFHQDVNHAVGKLHRCGSNVLGFENSQAATLDHRWPRHADI